LKGRKSSNTWEKITRSKFYSGRNKEQVDVRECLLIFGAESSVFHLAIQKIKNQDIQTYNFARFSKRV
jgi:hypothetical protein